MGREPLHIGRAVGPSLTIALPAAVLFAVLAGLGHLPALTALVAFFAVAFCGFAAMLIRQTDIDGLGAYIDELLRRDQADPPSIRFSPLTREFAHGLDRLNRSRMDRIDRLSSDAQEIGRVLDALPDPFFLLDGDRQILRTNNAARELFGSEIEGRDVATALRNPAVLEAIDSARDAQVERAVDFSVAEPAERHYTARIDPRGFGAGGEAAMLLTLHDVTAMKRSEQMRADFVANASHEIRTPLAGLIGYIETLRGLAKDDPVAKDQFFEIMEQNARRMAHLVDDLLSLSRIEMKEHETPEGDADIPALLDAARGDLAWNAEQRGIAITLETEGRPLIARGDGGELSQVFHNLLDNAIKYGDANGAVTITARPVSPVPAELGWPADAIGAIAVSVADQGEGIPREHLARLTERFYRVDTARSRELGGTGLGLAIVKHIVARHRGSLAIESELGDGSTFTVFLRPAPQEENEP